MTTVDRPTERAEQTPPVIPSSTRWPTPQVVVGAVLVLVGGLWLLERLGAIEMSATAVLGLGTLVVGLALMVLSRRQAHGGLIVFGTILALITLATAAAPLEGFQGGIGDRSVVVDTIDEMQPDYNLSMGTLTIDLSKVTDLEASTPLTARVGMGELLVRVPPGTEVSVDAQAGAGEVVILGRSFDGVGIDQTFQTPGFEEDRPGLVLEVEVFLGRVEVTDE